MEEERPVVKLHTEECMKQVGLLDGTKKTPGKCFGYIVVGEETLAFVRLNNSTHPSMINVNDLHSLEPFSLDD